MPNNMGMVRYALALIVVMAHFQLLTGYSLAFPFSSFSAVGGFFALSGFLIYGSFIRKPDLKAYVISRARRLLPAYWITVLFFAIVLCAVSSLSVSDYFTSASFRRYLVSNLAFLNFLQPTLPGVFEGFEHDAVNGSLWTLKVEWCLYFSVPAVAWLTRRLKARPTVMFVAIYLAACVYRMIFLYLYGETGSKVYEILGRQFFGQLSYFYAGVLCYYWFDLLMRYKWPVIAVAVSVILTVDALPYDFFIFLHPAALAVIVVWFSMVGKWGTWEGKRDNVSYNIYLIHFPVIQVYVFLGGSRTFGLVPSLVICLCVIFVMSWLLSLAELRIRRHLGAESRPGKRR